MATKPSLSAQVQALEDKADQLNELSIDQQEEIQACHRREEILELENERLEASVAHLRHTAEGYAKILDEKEAELAQLKRSLKNSEDRNKKLHAELDEDIRILQATLDRQTNIVTNLHTEVSNREDSIKYIASVLRTNLRAVRVTTTSLKSAFKLITDLKDLTTLERLLHRTNAAISNRLVDRELASILTEAGVPLPLEGLNLSTDADVMSPTLSTPRNDGSPALRRSARKRKSNTGALI